AKVEGLGVRDGAGAGEDLDGLAALGIGPLPHAVQAARGAHLRPDPHAPTIAHPYDSAVESVIIGGVKGVSCPADASWRYLLISSACADLWRSWSAPGRRWTRCSIRRAWMGRFPTRSSSLPWTGTGPCRGGSDSCRGLGKRHTSRRSFPPRRSRR